MDRNYVICIKIMCWLFGKEAISGRIGEPFQTAKMMRIVSILHYGRLS